MVVRLFLLATALSTVAAFAQPSDAREYDRLIGRWNRQLAPEFLRFTGITDGAKILDYSCATGSLALRAGAKFAHSDVTGVDLAEVYTAWARMQSARATVRFRTVEDLMRLPFANGEFDAALTLAVSALPEIPRAVAEMRRVTKPEGVVAAATWDYGSSMQPLELFHVAAGPQAPMESNTPLAAPGALEKLFKEAQLRDVTEQSLDVDLSFRDFDDYWSLFSAGRGTEGEWLLTQPTATQAAIRERIRARIPKGPFTLRARVLMVKGVVRYY